MSRKRELGDDELALWHEVMRDVRRPTRRRKTRAAAPVAEKKTPSKGPPSKTPKAAPAPSAPPQPVVHRGRGIPGLDGATAERLRKGKIEPDATLDLHGMTQAQAHTRLVSFVRQRHERGDRCVLIVTGKGSPMRGEPHATARGFVMPERSKAGVLRELAPMWLESAETRALVVGVQPAHARHGGGGAFYVYLRRKTARA